MNNYRTNARKPIQVYLDSSDYSILSNPQILNSDPELKAIRKYLERSVSKGVIHIRYSPVHISEISPTGEDAHQYSINRAALINQLCRGRCLIDFSELMIIDIIHRIKETSSSAKLAKFPQYSFSEDNQWLLSLQNEALLIRQELLMRIIKEARSMPFPARGLIEDAIRKKKLNPELQKIFRKSCSELFLWGDNYLDSRIANGFLQYVFGETSNSEFVSLVSRHIFNPRSIVTLIRNNLFEADKIPLAIRSIGREVARSILSTRGHMPGLRQYAYACNKSDKNLMSEIKKMINIQLKEKAMENLCKSIETSNWLLQMYEVSHQEAIDAVLTHEYIEYPCVAALTDSCIAYAIDSLNKLRNERSLLDSDTGDLFHSAFLPYVDIFRADGYFAGLIKKSAVRYDTIVVPKLKDLQRAIEEMRVARSGSI